MEIFMDYKVNFSWDAEASVWIATSDDIPGLVLESESFDKLLDETRYAAGELIAMNCPEATAMNILFLSQRRERMVL